MLTEKRKIRLIGESMRESGCWADLCSVMTIYLSFDRSVLNTEGAEFTESGVLMSAVLRALRAQRPQSELT